MSANDRYLNAIANGDLDQLKNAIGDYKKQTEDTQARDADFEQYLLTLVYRALDDKVSYILMQNNPQWQKPFLNDDFMKSVNIALQVYHSLQKITSNDDKITILREQLGNTDSIELLTDMFTSSKERGDGVFVGIINDYKILDETHNNKRMCVKAPGSKIKFYIAHREEVVENLNPDGTLPNSAIFAFIKDRNVEGIKEWFTEHRDSSAELKLPLELTATQMERLKVSPLTKDNCTIAHYMSSKLFNEIEPLVNGNKAINHWQIAASLNAYLTIVDEYLSLGLYEVKDFSTIMDSIIEMKQVQGHYTITPDINTFVQQVLETHTKASEGGYNYEVNGFDLNFENKLVKSEGSKLKCHVSYDTNAAEVVSSNSVDAVSEGVEDFSLDDVVGTTSEEKTHERECDGQLPPANETA